VRFAFACTRGENVEIDEIMEVVAYGKCFAMTSPRTSCWPGSYKNQSGRNTRVTCSGSKKLVFQTETPIFPCPSISPVFREISKILASEVVTVDSSIAYDSKEETC